MKKIEIVFCSLKYSSLTENPGEIEVKERITSKKVLIQQVSIGSETKLTRKIVCLEFSWQ